MILNHESVPKIKKIFHLSDIHIRLYARHEEYRIVFQKVNDYLKTYENESCCIVITGDIVHNKNDLSPELNVLTFEFLRDLSELFPCFVIAGNHDALLTNLGRVDSLSSILFEREIPNLYYLRNTQMYEFSNLRFYVDSLLDEETIDMTSTNAEISNEFINIALYHGSIPGWKNTKNFVSKDGDKHVEEFSGMDYLLLGDIHLHQYMSRRKPVAAYASSLISQNFNEIDENHGLLVWNVETKEQEYVRIPNDYRYQLVTIDENNTLLYDNYRREVEECDLAIRGHIKIKSNQNEIKSREIFHYLQRKYPRASFCFEIASQKYSEHQDGRIDDSLQTENDMILQFIQNKIKKEHVDSISSYILSIFKENQIISDNTQYKIQRLEFSHLFGYGANNVLNFEKYNHDRTVYGIFGENASGKSSLIDILSVLLYDKLTRYSHGVSIPKEIINFDEKKAFGKITLCIGPVVYTIEKYYQRNENQKVSQKTKLFQNEEGVIKELTGEQRLKTNKFIQTMIGSSENFLFFNMYLQQRENSFREMSTLKRKQFLNGIYGYSFCDQYEKLHKEKVKQFEIEYKLYMKKQSENSNMEFKTERTRFENRYSTLKLEKQKTKEDMMNMEKQIREFSRQLTHDFANIEDIKKEQLQIKTKLQDCLANQKKIQLSLNQWKSLHYLESKQRFVDNSFFLNICSNKTNIDFKRIKKEFLESKEYAKQNVSEIIKNLYCTRKQCNFVIDQNILSYFPVTDFQKIETKFELLLPTMQEIHETIKRNYNNLSMNIDDVSEKAYSLWKSQLEKEMVDLKSRLEVNERKTKHYQHYQEFKNKVNLSYYMTEYDFFKNDALFLDYSPLFSKNTKSKWDDFQQSIRIQDDYDSVKKEMEEINHQIEQIQEKLIALPGTIDSPILSESEYKRLKKEASILSTFFITEDFETRTRVIEKYDKNLEILHEKLSVYQVGVKKYKDVPINKNCSVCRENKLYKKKVELEHQCASISDRIQDMKTCRKKEYSLIQEILVPFREKDDHVRFFLDNQQSLVEFIHTKRDYIKKEEKKKKDILDYEVHKKYVDYTRKKKKLLVDKKEKNKQYEKIVFYHRHERLICFINYQYQFNYDVQKMLKTQEKIDSELNRIEEQGKELKQEYSEKENERETGIVSWKQNISRKVEIQTLENKVVEFEKMKQWKIEYIKWKDTLENEKIQVEIQEMERRQKLISYYSNQDHVIEFLDQCFQHKNWRETKEEEIEPLLQEMNQKKETNEKEIEVLQRNLIDMKYDEEIMSKIETLEQQSYHSILEALENDIQVTRSSMDELSMKEAIYKETQEKLYELTEKIKWEKDVISILEKDGLPLFLLREKILQVELKLNTMIQPFISKKVQLKITEDKNNIEFGFLSTNGQLCSFCSGMEAFILDICLKLCLSYFYIRPKSNLFIIDEKVSVLDKNKLSSLGSLFDFLKSTGTNVMIISHIEQVKDFVDKSILITKNNKSRVDFQ